MSKHEQNSTEEQVYWSSIEFKMTPKHHQYGETKGGFVFVFLKTLDVRSFIAAIEKDFKENHFEIVKLEYVNPYDTEHQWEEEEDAQHFTKLYREAETTGELVFDELYRYEDFED